MNGKKAQTQTSWNQMKETYNRFEMAMFFTAIFINAAGICVGMLVATGPRLIWSDTGLWIWTQIIAGVLIMTLCTLGAQYIARRVRSLNRERRQMRDWSFRDMDDLEKRITELERAVKGNEKD